MARGRFLSETVATDARLNSLSIEAELVYLMSIPHLDRDGLIEGDPDVLWGRVCPKRRQFLDRMAEYVQQWARAGLVLCYDTEEGVVLWFKGFTKNQLGLRYDRESPSRFPPPPGHCFGKDGIMPIPDPSSGPPSSVPTPPHVPPPADQSPESNLSTTDSIRQESGKMPEASGKCVAQLEVKDQVKDQDQSSPPTPSSSTAETNADDDEETNLRRALAAKLHSVGVQVTEYSMSRYLDYANDYGLDAVLVGLTSAADNGKQHRLNYVSRCIVTAAQGTHYATHNGHPQPNHPRNGDAQFSQEEFDAYQDPDRDEIPY